MSRIGISITKRTAFRDSVQEFSNVYHYESGGAYPDPIAAALLIDELVTFEKSCHATSVTFVQAKCWKAGESKEQNVMIAQKVLTGTGSTSASSGMDKERAYLVQWSAGVDSRGKPVRLKKWFHACGFFAGHTLDSSKLDNTTGFSTADRNAIATKADECKTIGDSNQWVLAAASGRQMDNAAAAVAHKYLEHHQLGDQWRG
jgi:hypothetical protein